MPCSKATVAVAVLVAAADGSNENDDDNSGDSAINALEATTIQTADCKSIFKKQR